MTRFQSAFAAGAFLALSGMSAWAQQVQHCYPNYIGVRPNKLYLYFPAVADPSYPEFSAQFGDPPTQPAQPFDVAQIPNYTGTAADLEFAVYEAVADEYCEFDIEVISTTTAPPATFPRRNTVSIGTDDATSWQLFGIAQALDTGDATAVDFAHVWVGTYQGEYGFPGQPLNGANSTLPRWAYAIAGSVAHEAGHNYGLSHNDGLIIAGPWEPYIPHHIMAPGSYYSGWDRTQYRYFSSHELSVLAANVGLTVKASWNYDFINPNASSAAKVMMDILSVQNPLLLASAYTGPESPWSTSTVSPSLGLQTFKGGIYHHYQVTWSVPQSWNGHIAGGPGPMSGTPGVVEGGASFHIGAGFSGVDYSQPDPIIVTGVTLYDTNGAALPINPRTVSFDAGALDALDGAYNINVFNVAGAPMQLNSVVTQLLPMMLPLEGMTAFSKNLKDVRGVPFEPWGRAKAVIYNRLIEEGGSLALPIKKLKDGRNIFTKVDSDCANQDRLSGPDVVLCRPGWEIDLFPATTTYLKVSMTDPNLTHFDYKTQQYVTGPVTTHAMLQITGRHPDLNRNGIDDTIDIAEGRSKDKNRDGVPDEVQKHRR